ncbi:hypothetical protein HDE_00714 [Halotydeus destructor]|nr:hypothetical protein HDE_00714 [Halotydeus destructor]
MYSYLRPLYLFFLLLRMSSYRCLESKTSDIATSSATSQPKESLVNESEIQEIWDRNCKQDIDRIKCSQEFSKIYRFDEDLKDFDSARNYCRQQFEDLSFADLITIGSCDEYRLVKQMLLTIGNRLGKSGKPMEIWTGGLEVPSDIGSKKYWLGDEEVKYVNLDEACENKTDSDMSQTADSENADNNGTVAQILTFKLHRENESEVFNFTESYTPWDERSEVRYALCEFRVPKKIPETTTAAQPLEPSTDLSSTPGLGTSTSRGISVCDGRRCHGTSHGTSHGTGHETGHEASRAAYDANGQTS